ncbi:hypothetical protein PPTG_23546 [Phytophthora nicotianae INRA-310]|uniref:Uncharacterized protein n=1 Tax=Phytophthora nicotianae (strain INRA-310) TaxID=761204 RepID=W2PX17_PHYN3|nr:hypothetical protein PPTG_23546 [Phytophthora nicotianae INRA-310]ETN05191.1 hypothetical protein PPTG_23546 [Phytophthora nicotianae INRA-310]
MLWSAGKWKLSNGCCINPTRRILRIVLPVTITLVGNNHPEVVKWYGDHFGNPRKRKYAKLC